MTMAMATMSSSSSLLSQSPCCLPTLTRNNNSNRSSNDVADNECRGKCRSRAGQALRGSDTRKGARDRKREGEGERARVCGQLWRPYQRLVSFRLTTNYEYSEITGCKRGILLYQYKTLYIFIKILFLYEFNMKLIPPGNLTQFHLNYTIFMLSLTYDFFQILRISC